MIDTFALLLTHALLALIAWRVSNRPDLDRDGATKNPSRWPRRDA